MKIAFWSNANEKCMVSANLAAIAVASVIRYPYTILTMENRLCNNNLGKAFQDHGHISGLYDVGTNYYEGGGMEGLMRKIYRGDDLQGGVLKHYVTEVIGEHLYYIPQSKVIHSEIFDYEFNECLHPLLQMAEEFADICFIDTASHRNLSTKTILQEADLIVVNLCQNKDILEDFFLNYSSIISKCIFVIGNYTPSCLYPIRNIASMYSLMPDDITAITCNEAYFEAFHQGAVVEFISRNYYSDKDSPNYVFIQSVKKTAFLIIKKAVELSKQKENDPCLK